MTNSNKPTAEERLATEFNGTLAASVSAQRMRNLLLAVVCLLASILVAFASYWMITLVLIVLGLIFFSQYLDANGHLHEIRRRSTRKLAPDFSVLRRGESASTVKNSTPSP